jgi:SAM-dependent methyltransferase
MDLTEAVDVAARDHGAIDNLHFVQGDIMAPPFAPGAFDFVVADQVIHHTPDTPRAFATLARLVAPGGQISVYVYRRKGLMRELADDHVRALTTAMSVDECMEFSEQVTELGRELSRVGGTVTLSQGVPLLGIPPGEHDVQRLLYWHFLKCFWSDDFGQDLSVQTNFDWYHPPYATRHTEDEVRGWSAAAGLDVVHLDTIESGISFRARRPA